MSCSGRALLASCSAEDAAAFAALSAADGVRDGIGTAELAARDRDRSRVFGLPSGIAVSVERETNSYNKTGTRTITVLPSSFELLLLLPLSLLLFMFVSRHNLFL